MLDGPQVGNQSYVCQSFVKAILALRDGFRWSMAMGDSSIWYEDRLGTGKLCEKIPFVHIHDSNLRLRDVRRDGDWAWDILWTSLPHEICEDIASFPICGDSPKILRVGYGMIQTLIFILLLRVMLGLLTGDLGWDT